MRVAVLDALALEQAATGLKFLQNQRIGFPDRLADQLANRQRRRVAEEAAIVADPGWLEAHFPLSTVSIDLRRAGLDLDPGYLPWLGVVVRFVYE